MIYGRNKEKWPIEVIATNKQRYRLKKNTHIQSEFLSKLSQTNKHTKGGEKVCNIAVRPLKTVQVKGGPKTKTNIC